MLKKIVFNKILNNIRIRDKKSKKKIWQPNTFTVGTPANKLYSHDWKSNDSLIFKQTKWQIKKNWNRLKQPWNKFEKKWPKNEWWKKKPIRFLKKTRTTYKKQSDWKIFPVPVKQTKAYIFRFFPEILFAKRKARIYKLAHVDFFTGLLLNRNLPIYPQYTDIRFLNKKQKKWRKHILYQGLILAQDLSNRDKPWNYITLPTTPLATRLDVLYAKYNDLMGAKKKYKRNFVKNIKGSLLKQAFLHKKQQYIIPGLFKINLKYNNELINNTIAFKKTFVNVRKLTWNYRKSFIMTQLTHYEKKKMQKKFMADKFALTFHNHYEEQILYPWRDALMFKRYIYTGSERTIRKQIKHLPLSIKPALRLKQARLEHRNKLFKWFNILFRIKDDSNTFQKGKHARIKQILSRIVLSFYGRTKIQHFKYLYEKAQGIKSNTITKLESILSKLELRLDVLIYRLNLAPSLFWAKQLIETGQIFVYRSTKQTDWIHMNQHLWKIAFPLRLRDPKMVYSKNPWLKSLHLQRFNFFLAPITNPNYIAQVGDIVYSSPHSTLNKFQANIKLFKKPIPAYLMTNKEAKFIWDAKLKMPRLISTAMWQKEGQHSLASVILFHPRFSDLEENDRITLNSFAWICS